MNSVVIRFHGKVGNSLRALVSCGTIKVDRRTYFGSVHHNYIEEIVEKLKSKNVDATVWVNSADDFCGYRVLYTTKETISDKIFVRKLAK